MLDFFRPRTDEMVTLLTALVEHESFSAEKAAVDRLGDFITQTVQTLNPSSISRIPLEAVGDIRIAKWNEGASGKPIVVLMHMDTVWPLGTLAERPVSIADGVFTAPGAVDMKGGIVVALSAIKGLIDQNELPKRPVWLMFTADEEIGSLASEPHIRAAVKDAALVLVMEPPTADGALKTSRKGGAVYKIVTRGKAAHAGNNPEQGINAILEMAYQIIAISKLQELKGGLSVAVNVIHGGTATNVIADYAEAEIDVRAFIQYHLDNVHDELVQLQPRLFGSKVEVTLHHKRGAMERDSQMDRTFRKCRQIAKDIGMAVDEDSVGGMSDANITASMGVPTLDGLGAGGGGMHALDEHVMIRTLPEKAALLAA
ncbi:MAG: M20/M25/M40 family metallo-hydrolase, partial [Phototrophicaceae bacterium]